MNIGEIDTKLIITSLGVLAVGGVGALGIFLGSEFFLNPNSNVGDLVNSVAQGDIEGVVNNLVGDESNTSETSTSSNTSDSNLENTQSNLPNISLVEARSRVIEFVGEGEIIDSKVSSLSAYAFEFTVLLPDGYKELVFVTEDGNVEIR